MHLLAEILKGEAENLIRQVIVYTMLAKINQKIFHPGLDIEFRNT